MMTHPVESDWPMLAKLIVIRVNDDGNQLRSHSRQSVGRIDARIWYWDDVMLVRFLENLFIGGIRMREIVCINFEFITFIASVLIKWLLYSDVIGNNRCLHNANVTFVFIRSWFWKDVFFLSLYPLTNRLLLVLFDSSFLLLSCHSPCFNVASYIKILILRKFRCLIPLYSHRCFFNFH